MFRIHRMCCRQIEQNLIEYSELIEKIKKGAILVDVRSPQEYREGHLEHAISIPEYEIKRKILNIIPNKQTEVVLYCSYGGRSKRAADIMKKYGYANVYELNGGLEKLQK